MSSTVLDYAADVAPGLQVLSDGLGWYLNSKTLVSQIQPGARSLGTRHEAEGRHAQNLPGLQQGDSRERTRRRRSRRPALWPVPVPHPCQLRPALDDGGLDTVVRYAHRLRLQRHAIRPRDEPGRPERTLSRDGVRERHVHLSLDWIGVVFAVEIHAKRHLHRAGYHDEVPECRQAARIRRQMAFSPPFTETSISRSR